jgi:hypothetical protein
MLMKSIPLPRPSHFDFAPTDLVLLYEGFNDCKTMLATAI